MTTILFPAHIARYNIKGRWYIYFPYIFKQTFLLVVKKNICYDLLVSVLLSTHIRRSPVWTAVSPFSLIVSVLSYFFVFSQEKLIECKRENRAKNEPTRVKAIHSLNQPFGRLGLYVTMTVCHFVCHSVPCFQGGCEKRYGQQFITIVYKELFTTLLRP